MRSVINILTPEHHWQMTSPSSPPPVDQSRTFYARILTYRFGDKHIVANASMCSL